MRITPNVSRLAQGALSRRCIKLMAQCHPFKGVPSRPLQPEREVLPDVEQTRRSTLFLLSCVPLLFPRPSDATVPVQAVTIDPSLAPDQSLYDPSDPALREAASLIQAALQTDDVKEEERLWTKIIDTYGQLDVPWVPDVVGRALGNRGNARSRQGKLEDAVLDYNASIRLCPWSVDPVLNRGAVLESLGRFEEAVRDYRSVLAVAPKDPAAWNNLGNATAGLQRWDEAAEYFQRAVALSPEFSFAAANKALALYQMGNTQQALREMRALLRRYPDFPDMRAALAAGLWGEGLEGEAENNWLRVTDPRYRSLTWLKDNRRWPPRLIASLEAFLQIKSL